MTIFETINSSEKLCVNRDIFKDYMTIQIEYISGKIGLFTNQGDSIRVIPMKMLLNVTRH